MADLEEHQLRPAYLAGVLEALRGTLEAVVTQLPERAMVIVDNHVKRLSEDAEKEARERQTDLLRDRASGIYDTVESLREAVYIALSDLEEGAVIRTVQPYPIAPSDMLYPDKGY